MGKKFWRSLDEYSDTPEFREKLEKEFPNLLPDDMSSGTRRRFLQLMGASFALAGVAGCNNPTWPRWPKAKILPFAFRPEGRTPGEPVHYATSLELGGAARPLLAKSYDGRPIKLEGNPEHPASLGAADLLAQASILGLYDPDRSHGPAHGGQESVGWAAFDDAMGKVLASHRASKGAGLRFLTEASSSPSLTEARARFSQEFPRARWHEWEPISRDNAREGAKLVFGEVRRTHYDPSRADVIVSLDEDFLMEHPNALAYARAFADRRRPENHRMNRLYCVESAYSITGSVADHRHPVPSNAIGQVAWNLAARLVLEEGVALPGGFPGMPGLLQTALSHGEHHPWIARMAKELAEHRGHGLVMVGPSQPAGLHALAHVLNEALGNTGSTVYTTADIAPDRAAHVESIRDLVGAMGSGKVESLVILGGNPVYDAPGDLGFAAALAKVRLSCHLSMTRDETSRACTWHVPRAHFLEAWSDSLSWDGTYTIAQPLIESFYGGRTPAELVASFAAGTPVTGRELVQSTFEKRFGAASSWRRALHDGFAKDSAFSRATPSFGLGTWSPREEDFAWHRTSGSKLEVVFKPDYTVWDGRFANNGWLQEMPDPMTKLTWDNAALINPDKASALGIAHGDVIELRAGDRTLSAPAYLMAGQAMDSVTIALGYGRTAAGHVAEGAGVSAYPLRTTRTMGFAKAVDVARTGARYELASTQSHHAIFNRQQGLGQEERLGQLLRGGTYDEWKHHPDFAKHAVHHPPLKSLWNEFEFNGRRWGMTIDLSTCTGCSACVIACQAENNVPIVGKKEVSLGREMQWLRVDRYFEGEGFENPRVAHQVVACQHCENAPCEQVCPVAATLHDAEGLNVMVYNRCVGTRYCSNNCPYKVRRFNWFNNTRKKYNDFKLFEMQRNPDVTVRARGVMEKCTYCVQRIKAATIPADNERRPVRDGEIVPACAQTCPTQAIVFGDLADRQSRVRQLQELDRSYAMLEELNVKPRTKYLAKITNPAGGGAAHETDHHAHAPAAADPRG